MTSRKRGWISVLSEVTHQHALAWWVTFADEIGLVISLRSG
jgi:hypothetical protein